MTNASDNSVFELWDAALPLPSHESMRQPRVITQLQIERGRQGQYHYLHECAMAWHKDQLHVIFANHPIAERNTQDEVIRGRVSRDGLTFSEARVLIQQPVTGSCGFNHPVMAEHEGRLWAFVARWEKDNKDCRAEAFTLNEQDQSWQPAGGHIDTFIPFHPPMKMSDGNWIMGGESGWSLPAVAISRGDDWLHWTMVLIPDSLGLARQYPEVALIDQGDRLVAVCRPFVAGPAPVSISTDQGKTWSDVVPANLPIARGQPGAGLLSTGQHYLLFNDVHEGRTLLAIALTEPGGRTFKYCYKVRHQKHPLRRLFAGATWIGDKLDTLKSRVGQATEWSYPAAVEHQGKLYIACTQGKEDAAMSIIPIDALDGSDVV